MISKKLDHERRDEKRMVSLAIRAGSRKRKRRGRIFQPVLRPHEDYAATVSRCATFASRDIIATALRCKIFARASSPIFASASALLVHSQPNSVPSVPHTMRSAPYKRTAASIAPGPNELQSTYTFARRKRDDGSSSFAVSSRLR